jgi:hypothetical protein
MTMKKLATFDPAGYLCMAKALTGAAFDALAW